MFSRNGSLVPVSRGLGWVSLAIELAERAAPRQVAAMLGIDGTPQQRGVLRTLGLRELMHGVSLLSEQRPNRNMAAGAWARVAGDGLDAALLCAAAARARRPGRLALVSSVVLGIGALDLTCARRLGPPMR